LRWECLGHFIFFGLKHLDSVAACYLEYYLVKRPHQGKDNELLKGHWNSGRRGQTDQELRSLHDVRCEQRLGGLLKHYSRKAA
jgi:putative transposase